MGERLRKLTVEAFRGVPVRWEIEWPAGESMVVKGDNGTGKSTIADALEWFYGGRIEFLAHEGRDRAVRHQGASRTTRTRVTVGTDGTSGGVRELPAGTGSPWGERRISDTFVLRGRTLSDFVEKPKADKFRVLAPILGLQAIDRLRQDLQTVRNQLDDARTARVEDRKVAAAALRPVIGVVDEGRLLRAIADRCRGARLQEPQTLEAALDPAWLPAQLVGERSERAAALAGLLAEARALIAMPPAIDGAEAWNDYLASAGRNEPVELRFAQAADAFVSSRPGDGTCPLCGQPVDDAALSLRVTAMLDALRAASSAHEAAERELRQVGSSIKTRAIRLADLRKRAVDVGLVVPTMPVSPGDHIADCQRTSVPVAMDRLSAYDAQSRDWLAELGRAVEPIPAASPVDALLIELATIREQARRWRIARDAAAAAGRASDLSARIHDTCQRIENRQYEAILGRISCRVAELYEALHPNEGLSGVSIEPWTEKGLELVVEFHGTRQRPPHGVLSESHLNSLAVALFLAMADLYNERLDVIVLDDVVSSFDVEHRGRLAELLVSGFPKHQVIVLTHDHQFYTHLVRRAPSWLQLELTSWSFEDGPRPARYATGSLIAGAQGALGDGDVSGAAQKARRAMEELIQEACEAMAAKLPFRRGHANDRRDLAELLGGLRGRIKSMSKGWYESLLPTLTGLEADVQAALNIEVHAGGGWASRSEVEATLARLGSLDAAFTCGACRSRIWAVGTRDGGRCSCGASPYPPLM